jgi:phosphoribosylamine--glycine ligase
MRILVLGQGGREHALVRALKYSSSVTEVHAIPGSVGISQDAICHDMDLTDVKAVQSFAKQFKIDCVVIGPETYLVDGLADDLRLAGINVVGPSQAAAQLEGSKIFANEFMVRSGVPTAKYVVVQSVKETMAAVDKFTPPYVLKADGLAAGKGVFLCASKEELQDAAKQLFEDKTLGEAGRRALLEQFQPGYEISYLILTNGHEAQLLPLAQDHKRLLDGDLGPNTGGMGVLAPLSISESLRVRIEKEIIQPTLKELSGSGMLYRGVLYFGLMITEQGPTVLEFNVRFGDPEAQVILPSLDGDWGAVFASLAKGELVKLNWKNISVACVVQAASGYPANPEKGVEIEGDLGRQSHSSYFLHAGTTRSANGPWKTNGGRVLNAVGIGSSHQEALSAAYEQAGFVNWQGLQMRKDIGQKVLART